MNPANFSRDRALRGDRVGPARKRALVWLIAGTILLISAARGNVAGVALALGLVADDLAPPSPLGAAPSFPIAIGVAAASPASGAILGAIFVMRSWLASVNRDYFPRALIQSLVLGCAFFVGGNLLAASPLRAGALYIAALVAIGAIHLLADWVRGHQPGFETRSRLNAMTSEPLMRLGIAVITAGIVASGSPLAILALLPAAGYLGAAQWTRERRREDRAAMLQALSGLLQYAHPYTLGHMQRVAAMADRLGARMRLGPAHRQRLAEAALLHDIGKVALDEAVLEANRPLTPAEWEHVKNHTTLGADIVSAANKADPAVPWIRHHHERMDGAGYPAQLAGDQIPLESRMIAVIDAYDAMTGAGYDATFRRYQPPVNAAEARLELRRCAGTQFDPQVVAVFEAVLTEELE